MSRRHARVGATMPGTSASRSRTRSPRLSRTRGSGPESRATTGAAVVDLAVLPTSLTTTLAMPGMRRSPARTSSSISQMLRSRSVRGVRVTLRKPWVAPMTPEPPVKSIPGS